MSLTEASARTADPVEGPVGATFDYAMDWERIDWARCRRIVRRRQIRITKATRQGRWRVVRSLQRLLVRASVAKLLAIKQVTENRGKRTPGVDGELWTTAKTKSAAFLTLNPTGYRPQPLRRIHIPKSNGKMRPLGIPTMRDRAMQALHQLALAPVAETMADPNSYGFRPARSTADAIQRCFMVLAKRTSSQWILEGDIRGCFDHIDHHWLQQHVPMDKRLLRQWLKAGFMDKGQLFPTEAGTPQGGIVSPNLANLALDGLEKRLAEHFPKRSAPIRHKVHLVRYADDFIITSGSRERLENEVKPLVVAFLRERGLELSEQKTAITHIDQGFDFLGQNIRKYEGTLLIKPSRKSQKAFKAKVNALIKCLRTAPQEKLINALNPVIRGWANYHSSVVSKRVYCSMDHWLWRKLWSWACRRHPNKPKRWIKARYFDRDGSRDWIFRANKEVGKGGKIRRRFIGSFPTLTSMADTPIRRHVKINCEAHPFDPQWDSYFERRRRQRRAYPKPEQYDCLALR